MRQTYEISADLENGRCGQAWLKLLRQARKLMFDKRIGFQTGWVVVTLLAELYPRIFLGKRKVNAIERIIVMGGCIFCAIVEGKQEASIVYEDSRVMAFVDIFPINPGHTLVIPREHYAGLLELPADLGGEIFKVAMRVEEAIRQSDIPCAGTNFLLANGRAAGQEVFHLHLHVIPRLAADGSGFRFGSVSRSRPNRQELDELATKINARI